MEDWCIENMGERWSAVRGNRDGRWGSFYNLEKSRDTRGQDLTRGCVCYTFRFQNEKDAMWFKLRWL